MVSKVVNKGKLLNFKIIKILSYFDNFMHTVWVIMVKSYNYR